MLDSRSLTAWLVALTLVLQVSLAGAQEEAKPRAPWHPGNYWGVGTQLSIPNSDFSDRYSSGYGLQGLFNYPLIPLIDASGSVGWNRFPGAGDGDGIDIWELTLGFRFALGAFFMNGEMGHYSGVDEWSYVPGLGLRYDHWEFSLRIKAAGSNTWSGVRLGYYF